MPNQVNTAGIVIGTTLTGQIVTAFDGRSFVPVFPAELIWLCLLEQWLTSTYITTLGRRIRTSWFIFTVAFGILKTIWTICGGCGRKQNDNHPIESVFS
jgi:CHASE2 domain-containing sensor protein